MMHDHPGQLAYIQIDTADPERLAGFWAALFGVEIGERIGESPAGPRYVVLQPQDGGQVAFSFQWVPEEKQAKNRVHVDVAATQGLEEVTDLVEQQGGTRVRDGDFSEHGWRWRVMNDPEGNEFCLLPVDP